MQQIQEITRLLRNTIPMKKTLLFSILIFIYSIEAFSCSLAVRDFSFCEVSEYNRYMIASGKITKKIDRGYIIEVHEVYRGSEERCEIKVFEREDWNCTGIPFDYEIEFMGDVGDVILFHATPIETAETAWEEAGEYRSPYVKISDYDFTNLPLKKVGNKFKGFFAEGQKSIRADKVWQGLYDCGIEELLPQPRKICGEFPLKVYPNPANERVFLDQIVESFTRVQLFDLNGNLVHTQNSYDPSAGIPTANLASGLYIVVAEVGEATFRQKLLVSH
ncbi:MAG: T9SS type A sorting domain-containing protein [Bacteroidota bacterium]